MKFDFTKNYILQNEWVRLSPLDATHYDALELLSQEKELWTYFLEKGQGGKQFETYFQRALAARNQQKEYSFVVFDKTTQQYAGMTRFYDYSSELHTIKLGHTWYGKPFRGIGINKQCKYLLFEFAFEKLLVERIGFGAHAENLVSLAAMKSVGCQQEGLLRNFLPAINETGRADCVLLSILKSEWQQAEKDRLREKLNRYS